MTRLEGVARSNDIVPQRKKKRSHNGALLSVLAYLFCTRAVKKVCFEEVHPLSQPASKETMATMQSQRQFSQQSSVSFFRAPSQSTFFATQSKTQQPVTSHLSQRQQQQHPSSVVSNFFKQLQGSSGGMQKQAKKTKGKHIVLLYNLYGLVECLAVSIQ